MARNRTGGKVLRAWRLRQRPKLSQASLGAAFDISGTYVRKLENGQLEFTIPLSVKISQFTGIPMSSLLNQKRMKFLRALEEFLRSSGEAA